MLRKEVLSVVGVIVTALVFAFVFITFVFQTYQVSGVSMQQTLHNGDHLLVWKLPRT
jgi:signal peptidase I